ncbi:MAG TPA: hypothetical protein VK760_04840 [Candidatus Acidoferrales bacterium]|nr:hypothetical protein [Candidatus Acidoferrales bacterium]
MKTRLTIALALACSATAFAQVPSPDPNYLTMAPIERYLMPSAAAEIALARTAAPPSISSGAAILVLTKTGYVTAVKGTNGWTCLVGRAFQGGLDSPEFWSWRNRSPVCLNPPAVKSVLPYYEARTKWAFAGATRDELAKKAQAGYADHQFTDPLPGSFSFMLSKQAYLNDDVKGAWRPHVMLFVAMNQLDTWATGFEGSPIIAPPANTYRAYEPIPIFIPVHRWSDGSKDP